MLKRAFTRVLGFSFIILISAEMSFAHPDVVFIGAGPIGLYTAIQTVLHNPKVKIHFFERQEKYTRNNSVQIDSESFLNAHHDPEFRAIIESWGKSVPTLKLEGQLLEKAKRLGIEVENLKIEHPQQIIERFPDVKVIVASDGAHSLMRQSFIPEDQLGAKDLQFIAQVKYRVKGEARRLKQWTEALPLLSKVKHLVLESVGKKNDENESPVTLNIVLPESEYKLIKDKVTFKTPVKWPAEQNVLPKNLRKTIGRWIEGRHEEVVESSIEVTSTKLLMYFSPTVAFTDHEIQYYFVGDAAFGVPFFRSINNGFLSGNVLAKVLAHQFDEKLSFNKVAHAISSLSFSKVSSLVAGIAQATPADYQRYIKGLQIRENLVAQIKRVGVKVLQVKAAISRKTYEKGQFISHSLSRGTDLDPVEMDHEEREWDMLQMEEVLED
jgi:hypothetical protein